MKIEATKQTRPLSTHKQGASFRRMARDLTDHRIAPLRRVNIILCCELMKLQRHSPLDILTTLL
jgi:hypothetical protein